MKTYKNDRLVEPELRLARSSGGYLNTTLEPWQLPHLSLVKELSAPEIGAKDGAYFIRCMGSIRNNEKTEHTASVLILDGDSRITDDGEVLPGAPDPQLVYDFLTRMGLTHCIYSSHSNGLKGDDYFKYRVVMPCEYSREQLIFLLEWIHSKLHEAGVMLYNVKENKSWCQPWYFPRVSEDRKHLFRFYSHEGEWLDSELACNEWAERIEKDKANNPLIPNSEPAPKIHKEKQSYDGLMINPIEMFNNHWGDPFMYLQSQGYKCKITSAGPRLLRPGSESKIPGVSFCSKCKDGVLRVYSFGRDDLNNGFAHDAFDCFRLLEHGGNFNQALCAVGGMFYINNITLEQHNRREYMRQKSSQQGPVYIDWNAFLGRSV